MYTPRGSIVGVTQDNISLTCNHNKDRPTDKCSCVLNEANAKMDVRVQVVSFAADPNGSGCALSLAADTTDSYVMMVNQIKSGVFLRVEVRRCRTRNGAVLKRSLRCKTQYMINCQILSTMLCGQHHTFVCNAPPSWSIGSPLLHKDVRTAGRPFSSKYTSKPVHGHARFKNQFPSSTSIPCGQRHAFVCIFYY